MTFDLDNTSSQDLPTVSPGDGPRPLRRRFYPSSPVAAATAKPLPPLAARVREPDAEVKVKAKAGEVKAKPVPKKERGLGSSGAEAKLGATVKAKGKAKKVEPEPVVEVGKKIEAKAKPTPKAKPKGKAKPPPVPASASVLADWATKLDEGPPTPTALVAQLDIARARTTARLHSGLILAHWAEARAALALATVFGVAACAWHIGEANKLAVCRTAKLTRSRSNRTTKSARGGPAKGNKLLRCLSEGCPRCGGRQRQGHARLEAMLMQAKAAGQQVTTTVFWVPLPQDDVALTYDEGRRQAMAKFAALLRKDKKKNRKHKMPPLKQWMPHGHLALEAVMKGDRFQWHGHVTGLATHEEEVPRTVKDAWGPGCKKPEPVVSPEAWAKYVSKGTGLLDTERERGKDHPLLRASVDDLRGVARCARDKGAHFERFWGAWLRPKKPVRAPRGPRTPTRPPRTKAEADRTLTRAIYLPARVEIETAHGEIVEVDDPELVGEDEE